jgi:hypothetical protein
MRIRDKKFGLELRLQTRFVGQFPTLVVYTQSNNGKSRKLFNKFTLKSVTLTVLSLNKIDRINRMELKLLNKKFTPDKKQFILPILFDLL